MADSTADYIVRRLGQLKSMRSIHEKTYRDCYDYTFPMRGSGWLQNEITADQAKAKRAELLDSTATDAARILASSLMGGLTPANSRWFAMDVQGAGDEEVRWLDEAANTLWENIHAGNFDAAAFEAMLDAVCAGWFVLYVDEDKTRGGFSFQQWALPQVYAASTRPDGVVDTVFREFELTAEQAVAEYCEDKVSEQTRKLAVDKPDEKVKFVHAIHPRRMNVPGARLAKNLPFASCHVEIGTNKTVRESGYHEMPVIVPRWMVIPGTSYGIGPVFDALPDIKTLNEIKAMELASADLAVAGMWIAEDDGVLNPRSMKVGPRKVIVANSVDSIKPLTTGSDFNVSFSMADKLQAAIRKTLMADQLQPQDGPAMTATEVHVRVGLIRQMLGPVYGRLQAEYLQPLITRCFGLAFRAGVFVAPPETLAGREFSVRFISPVARAQKLEEVSAIDSYMQGLFLQLQAGQTDALDLIDLDEANRFRGNALGVPSKIIPAANAVKRMRAERAQQQQAAQQQQVSQAMQGAALEAGIQKVASQ